MKFKIHIALAILFLTLNAMRCDNTIFNTASNLIDINVENLNIDGEYLHITHLPVKKESYTLGIKYIGKDSKEQPYLYYYQDSVIEQKIYCNTRFDAKHPKGSDITKFFTLYPHHEYNGAKLKLTRTPIPGMHSFKVCIYRKDRSCIEKDTDPIEFY